MMILIFNKTAVEVESVDNAKALWLKWQSDKSLSSRTYQSVLLLDAEGKMVGFFSMNGRYWTRETSHGYDGSKTNWDLMLIRNWGKRIDVALNRFRPHQLPEQAQPAFPKDSALVTKVFAAARTVNPRINALTHITTNHAYLQASGDPKYYIVQIDQLMAIALGYDSSLEGN